MHKNSQIVTETSNLQSANDFAETNSQNVTECSILQSDNEFAEPFTQMDNDPTILQTCDEIEELQIEESTIPQNSSRIEYTPNGVDEIVRTPGVTYKHTELNTLVNPFLPEMTPTTSTRLASLLHDNDEDETKDNRWWKLNLKRQL